MDGEFVTGRTAAGDRVADQRDPRPAASRIPDPRARECRTRLKAEATADAVADVVLPEVRSTSGLLTAPVSQYVQLRPQTWIRGNSGIAYAGWVEPGLDGSVQVVRRGARRSRQCPRPCGASFGLSRTAARAPAGSPPSRAGSRSGSIST